MNRKDEILNCFKSSSEVSTIVINLIDDMIFLEQELATLKTLPHLRVHPTNPEKQEQTAASKEYNSKISRYADIVGKLTAILKREEIEEISPLRSYLNSLGQNKDDEE